ncbi:Kap120p [Maudiozyma barnettii]|uniref:Similar to Saccharomyces cerevisiae YPL125W KAP120 Karyopherin responsible for the nuclear import of ribosome maturation factor Rfp1p n=1 Tax=Maudiozyma barnettii TaxID=61262 RepID=A0A8H2ZI48_9SACH|nr:Kap120p [Kazachstania barnettii]CAB4252744.1 similar to Saccharomyces cerevisiae YPL125W KAP120 Karyopherin responsible for the nuclear import of ribosome maturation factor Rfp1p [Kazachstania barnettii]
MSVSNGAASLTELNVKDTLEHASNPQHAGSQVQRLAEEQLKEWSMIPGFHYILQSIYLDLSNSLQIRWLAVIQFKNGVEKYWRSTRINAISKEEKASIRSRLFDLIDEQNNQLCIQNAQAASRIARLDFPTEWPTLFEHIEQLLENEHINRDDIKLFNILVHVNQIVKILGTARIGRCKPAMQSKIPLIFPLIVRIYLHSFDHWTSRYTQNSTIRESDELTKLQVSYLALKVLRRIVCEGYERPHKDESVCEFIRLTISHFELLINNQENLGKLHVYEKFIKCYGKLYYNTVTDSPANFILLPSSTQILIVYTKLLFEKAPVVYTENSDTTGDFWEQTVIKGILLLKKVINFVCKKNVITLRARSDKITVEEAIEKISREFLNEDLIKKLVDVLMNWYLKLRPAELENWFIDPEEWINEQMMTSYEYQIRPCAENFFQDLINNFSDLLVPYLLYKIENEAASLTNSSEDFLKKDAIYASFQLSSNVVGDKVDFDNLLTTVFLPEASNTNVNSDQLKLIRRRVALIINEWSVVKCSEASKSLCYKFFGELLITEKDKVVLLTVVQALRTMIDDWNFDKDTFEPYLNDIITVLLREILPSVSLTETRLYVLNALTDIIIQTKPLLNKDLLIEIMQRVPSLWEVSTNNASETILSNALLRLLKHLVSSLGSYSYLTWEISIPLIRYACDPSSSQYQLLNEDGFELWSALLQHYSVKEHNTFDPDFIELLPFLEYAVDARTEILPTLLEIVKSYTLILNQSDFLSSDAMLKIFEDMAKYILTLREDSFQIILQVWELLILSNEYGGENLLFSKLFETGVTRAMFDAIFLEESLSSYQCGQIFQIVGRLAYLNPDALLESLAQYHRSLPTMNENAHLPMKNRKSIFSDSSFEVVVQRFLSQWIVCYKEIYDPKFKKIHIMGMSSLLRTKMIAIIGDLGIIISLWINMMEEINENSNGDCEKYHLNDIVTEQSLTYYPLTNEQLRQHELDERNDFVHHISFKDFITQILKFLEQTLGIQGYNELLNSVNPALLENLQLFLSVKSQQ